MYIIIAFEFRPVLHRLPTKSVFSIAETYAFQAEV